MHQDESLHEELVAEVKAIAPVMVEHSSESERLGRLDAPTMEALRRTRLLHLFCPRELGGLEADPVTALER